MLDTGRDVAVGAEDAVDKLKNRPSTTPLCVYALAGKMPFGLPTRRLADYPGPIKEVAILFFGIFMTIIPTLFILQAGEKGAMAGFIAAASRPWHYFWMSGGLSSFLDNAPTYLTYFNLTLGKLGITEAQVYQALRGAKDAMPPERLADLVRYLAAISAGSVFMGAIATSATRPTS